MQQNPGNVTNKLIVIASPILVSTTTGTCRRIRPGGIYTPLIRHGYMVTCNHLWLLWLLLFFEEGVYTASISRNVVLSKTCTVVADLIFFVSFHSVFPFRCICFVFICFLVCVPCFASQMFTSIYLAVLCWMVTTTLSHGSSFFLVSRGKPCQVSGSRLATVKDVSTRNKQTACAVMTEWAITHLKDGTMGGSGKQRTDRFCNSVLCVA